MSPVEAPDVAAKIAGYFVQGCIRAIETDHRDYSECGDFVDLVSLTPFEFDTIEKALQKKSVTENATKDLPDQLASELFNLMPANPMPAKRSALRSLSKGLFVIVANLPVGTLLVLAIDLLANSDLPSSLVKILGSSLKSVLATYSMAIPFPEFYLPSLLPIYNFASSVYTKIAASIPYPHFLNLDTGLDASFVLRKISPLSFSMPSLSHSFASFAFSLDSLSWPPNFSSWLSLPNIAQHLKSVSICIQDVDVLMAFPTQDLQLLTMQLMNQARSVAYMTFEAFTGALSVIHSNWASLSNPALISSLGFESTLFLANIHSAYMAGLATLSSLITNISTEISSSLLTQSLNAFQSYLTRLASSITLSVEKFNAGLSKGLAAPRPPPAVVSTSSLTDPGGSEHASPTASSHTAASASTLSAHSALPRSLVTPAPPNSDAVTSSISLLSAPLSSTLSDDSHSSSFSEPSVLPSISISVSSGPSQHPSKDSPISVSSYKPSATPTSPTSLTTLELSTSSVLSTISFSALSASTSSLLSGENSSVASSRIFSNPPDLSSPSNVSCLSCSVSSIASISSSSHFSSSYSSSASLQPAIMSSAPDRSRHIMSTGSTSLASSTSTPSNPSLSFTLSSVTDSAVFISSILSTSDPNAASSIAPFFPACSPSFDFSSSESTSALFTAALPTSDLSSSLSSTSTSSPSIASTSVTLSPPSANAPATLTALPASSASILSSRLTSAATSASSVDPSIIPSSKLISSVVSCSPVTSITPSSSSNPISPVASASSLPFASSVNPSSSTWSTSPLTRRDFPIPDSPSSVLSRSTSVPHGSAPSIETPSSLVSLTTTDIRASTSTDTRGFPPMEKIPSPVQGSPSVTARLSSRTFPTTIPSLSSPTGLPDTPATQLMRASSPDTRGFYPMEKIPSSLLGSPSVTASLSSGIFPTTIPSVPTSSAARLPGSESPASSSSSSAEGPWHDGSSGKNEALGSKESGVHPQGLESHAGGLSEVTFAYPVGSGRSSPPSFASSSTLAPRFAETSASSVANLSTASSSASSPTTSAAAHSAASSATPDIHSPSSPSTSAAISSAAFHPASSSIPNPSSSATTTSSLVSSSSTFALPVIPSSVSPSALVSSSVSPTRIASSAPASSSAPPIRRVDHESVLRSAPASKDHSTSAAWSPLSQASTPGSVRPPFLASPPLGDRVPEARPPISVESVSNHRSIASRLTFLGVPPDSDPPVSLQTPLSPPFPNHGSDAIAGVNSNPKSTLCNQVLHASTAVSSSPATTSTIIIAESHSGPSYRHSSSNAVEPDITISSLDDILSSSLTFTQPTPTPARSDLSADVGDQSTLRRSEPAATFVAGKTTSRSVSAPEPIGVGDPSSLQHSEPSAPVALEVDADGSTSLSPPLTRLSNISDPSSTPRSESSVYVTAHGNSPLPPFPPTVASPSFSGTPSTLPAVATPAADAPPEDGSISTPTTVSCWSSVETFQLSSSSITPPIQAAVSAKDPSDSSALLPSLSHSVSLLTGSSGPQTTSRPTNFAPQHHPEQVMSRPQSVISKNPSPGPQAGKLELSKDSTRRPPLALDPLDTQPPRLPLEAAVAPSVDTVEFEESLTAQLPTGPTGAPTAAPVSPSNAPAKIGRDFTIDHSQHLPPMTNQSRIPACRSLSQNPSPTTQSSSSTNSFSESLLVSPSSSSSVATSMASLDSPSIPETSPLSYDEPLPTSVLQYLPQGTLKSSQVTSMHTNPVSWGVHASPASISPASLPTSPSIILQVLSSAPTHTPSQTSQGTVDLRGETLSNMEPKPVTSTQMHLTPTNFIGILTTTTPTGVPSVILQLRGPSTTCPSLPTTCPATTSYAPLSLPPATCGKSSTQLLLPHASETTVTPKSLAVSTAAGFTLNWTSLPMASFPLPTAPSIPSFSGQFSLWAVPALILLLSVISLFLFFTIRAGRRIVFKVPKVRARIPRLRRRISFTIPGSVSVVLPKVKVVWSRISSIGGFFKRVWSPAVSFTAKTRHGVVFPLRALTWPTFKIPGLRNIFTLEGPKLPRATIDLGGLPSIPSPPSPPPFSSHFSLSSPFSHPPTLLTLRAFYYLYFIYFMSSFQLDEHFSTYFLIFVTACFDGFYWWVYLSGTKSGNAGVSCVACGQVTPRLPIL